ncbi:MULTISPECIES: hypothetical protein [unclassified Methylobacterium]|jgi:uncharacterized coiled-coil protein SlyX|uniref:hypothetical protein n=1 Tax=unclassified Methylobacterium TaxID=2615210 RepID=UPI0006F784B2|nr:MULTISPECIES: hypothetical protein [unclassified Methylobacterium]KQO75206.1 hypothetical protein ASF20_15315 [Methylobacterium sp. Leaf88]KQO75488.1 hypothetical protein ASF18_00070 [Methylobacterium sp. Leaf89]KQP75205.1 hypothetical protein ASF41_15740 [Methylobacterium sp. Leaf111]KQT71370.1 hypothetical protein ASG51_10520 [Methylobacterium sp. Leaf465]KQU19764.1 hypothetical protein ASG63_23310 [Methylobacterium sp. Leaf94]
MSDLESLLDRLKDAQRTLITEAAKIEMLPPDSVLRRVADLENTIAAVEALIEEQAHRRGRATG